LIIKAEYLDFLEKTQLDQTRPKADLSVTIPGQYPILEEHISVHRYFMGIEEKRRIPYGEAASHWFDKVYTPVAKLIQERGILRHFPGRTETDLYLWISKHHTELQESLGWEITQGSAIANLIESADQDTSKSLSKVGSKILEIITPAALESGPPVGEWRKGQLPLHRADIMFSDILVAISAEETGWLALEQALIFAQNESNLSHLHGLHVLSEESYLENEHLVSIQDTFSHRCQEFGVTGSLAFERGSVARRICERAQWVDLIITTLVHPPEDKAIKRLSSGFRTIIRRCPRPILAVPGRVIALDRALLAYDDSPKAKEALFIAAYFASKWGILLTVANVYIKGQSGEKYLADAQKYLEKLNIQADYVLDECDSISDSILEIAKKYKSELIVMGGYEASPVYEMVTGSTVDQVLRDTHIPVLICR
jgi:nucleotide-binding universal stress UspA family protein